MTLPLEPSDAEFAALCDACVSLVREHLRTLGEQPSADEKDFEPLRARALAEPLPEQGTDLAPLLDFFRAAVAKSFNTAGPGYMAFIPGGGLPSAAVADFLALATNRYVGVARAAPVLAAMETRVVGWMAQLMGYPASARGILTSGGSLSNLTAIVTAREARLGDDLAAGVIYASSETHVSVAKSARIAGLRNIRLLPTDSRLRLDVDALAKAVASDRAAGRKPFLVIANAGTTNTGAVDPIAAICDFAQREGLWVHADAAYGGFFRLIPPLLADLSRCDSITLDPHKGLFLPYGTGCLLVRDGDALARAHQSDAVYLRDVAAPPGEMNFTDLSPELSREFRGMRLWLPLRLHGVAAFRESLAEKLELTKMAWERLRQNPRFEILDEPQLSIVAFRLRKGDDAELLRRVNARGRVFLSSTTLDGRLALRICVLSFRTHEDRLLDAVDGLEQEASRL